MKINKIVLFLIIIVIAVGAYFYISSEINIKSPSLAASEEDFKIEASTLLSEYESNCTKANQKYLGKIILISGDLKSIETDTKGFHTLVIGDNSSMSSVRCSMDNSVSIDVDLLPAGTQIELRGECIGFNPDDLGLGADVVLNRSVIIKTNKK
jgi:hypothetical protein